MTCEDRLVPARPSRRLVLTGALTLSATAALTGCGVRLEDDAPNIPFVPERDPVPGEAVLLAVLGALEAGDAEHDPARATMLRKALEKAQIPESLLDGAKAPQAGAETVAAFEGAVRDCGPGLLTLVGRLTATRRILTDDRTRSLWTPAGTKPWKDGSVAAEALEATRAAVHAFELIGAKTSGGLAKSARAARQELQGLVTRQTTAAGEDVPAVSLGYELPHDLDAAKARALGTQSVERLLAAYAGGLAGLGEDRTAALEVTEWMAAVERVTRERFPLEVPELYGEQPDDS